MIAKGNRGSSLVKLYLEEQYSLKLNSKR